MVVFPNAKINIGLNVVAKRADGFHNIESIFHPVLDLCDALELVLIPGDEVLFSSSGIAIPTDNSNKNLCLKAYDLLREEHKLSGVKIHLQKNIPIGAGLGGGSADAAFMLKALNELFELDLTLEQLVNYAKQLGSDCAFFIENKPVYAFNKGDEFEGVSIDLSSYTIKIDYPNIHVSTKEAYQGVVPIESKTDLKALITEPIENWSKSIKNDFEQSVVPNHPQIEELKAKMYEDGARFASMTGSGSAVFGIF